MYKHFIRPILFRFNAETAHNITMGALGILKHIPLARQITRLAFCKDTPELSKEVFGRTFRNPVGLAGGLDKNGEHYNDLANFGFGFVEIGSLTPEPQDGNPKPRLFRLVKDRAIINRMGINNKGVKNAIEHLKKEKPDIIVAANISKNASSMNEEASKDYETAFALLYDFVDMFVVNISCPNVKQGGMAFGVTCAGAAEVVHAVRKVYPKTLIVKLSPNVTDISEIARAVEAEGADSVSLVNTFLGMAIDTETRRPYLSTITGGLSGPCIRPIAVRMVYQVAHSVKIPVIGLGGIMNGRDAIEFMLAGATAVQVGTANFVDPSVTMKIIDYMEEYLQRHNISSIREIIGGMTV